MAGSSGFGFRKTCFSRTGGNLARQVILFGNIDYTNRIDADDDTDGDGVPNLVERAEGTNTNDPK